MPLCAGVVREEACGLRVFEVVEAVPGLSLVHLKELLEAFLGGEVNAVAVSAHKSGSNPDYTVGAQTGARRPYQSWCWPEKTPNCRRQPRQPTA